MAAREARLALILLALLAALACAPLGAQAPASTTAPPSATPVPAEATATAARPAATATQAPATDTPEPSPTAEITLVPADTPTPPTPAPAASTDLGRGRREPAPRAAIVAPPNWEVQVIDYQRDAQAWALLRAMDEASAAAPSGWEYVLIRAHVKCTYAGADAHEIDAFSFGLTGDRLWRYFPVANATLDPILDAELRAGEETEGWVAFLAHQGEGSLMLIFEEWMSGNDFGSRYIALDDGASLAVDPALEAIKPTGTGASLDAPAPLGEKAVTRGWEVTALEVARGEAARAMAQSASDFNFPPAKGMEYIAVRLRVRRIDVPIGSGDSGYTMDSNYFTTTGSAGVAYEPPMLLAPEPRLDAMLYAGGEVEGWAVYQIGTGETKPVLVFEPFLVPSPGDTRYLSLE